MNYTHEIQNPDLDKLKNAVEQSAMTNKSFLGATYSRGTLTSVFETELSGEDKAIFDSLVAVSSLTASEITKEHVKDIINLAREFGASIINEFAAENVMMGITQDGQTGTVLDKMAGVMEALQSGSLIEAISRAKAIPPEQYDAKYVTAARLLTFVNEIERYLNISVSATL